MLLVYSLVQLPSAELLLVFCMFEVDTPAGMHLCKMLALLQLLKRVRCTVILNTRCKTSTRHWHLKLLDVLNSHVWCLFYIA